MSISRATTSKTPKLLLKKGSKDAAKQGSSSSLNVKIIHPKDNLGLCGWKYSERNGSIFIPEC